MGVEENLKARFAAEQVASLADDEAKVHGRRFWMELARIVGAHVPVKKDATRREKMTDVEARRFGGEPVPFGEFVGRRVDDVPLERLQWYASTTFLDDLRRYLNSDRLQREMD